MASLEERLRNHSKVFGQLLGLIPAKHYFSADDNSTQWNKRKQTKEEGQRAKKAKLDPGSVMSAADMRQEQQKKLAGCENKQRETKGEEEQVEEPVTKRQKKHKRKELAKEAKVATVTAVKKVVKNKLEDHKNPPPGGGKEAEVEMKDDGEAEEIQLNGFSFSTHLIAASSPLPKPEIPYSPPAISAEQRAGQRARLAARIEALRAKRRADSPDGTSARNRHELMAARRREEAIQRKERKKEIRSHQKATTEQTKVVAPPPVSNTILKTDETGSHGRVRGEARDLTSDRSEGGGKLKATKKPNSKKSRPGFEGSLKLSKRGGK